MIRGGKMADRKKSPSKEENMSLFDGMVLVDINNRADYFDIE